MSGLLHLNMFALMLLSKKALYKREADIKYIYLSYAIFSHDKQISCHYFLIRSCPDLDFYLPQRCIYMVCFDFVELKSFHQRDAVFNIRVCFDLFGPDENLEFITKKEIPRFNWIRNSPTKYAQIRKLRVA